MGKSQSKENTETWDHTGKQILKRSLTLMLMGKSGHGKSSLGNSLLGRETFEVSNYTTSQTAEVVCGYSDFESCSLKVVDVPGLQDTRLSQLQDRERGERNMSMSLTMCSEGVDAFLIVFRIDVFTRIFPLEEASVLQTLKSLLGQDYLKHAIVVLTHGDQFDMEGITFDDWCKKQTGPFGELYKACNGRFILFNNKEKDKEKQIAQRERLTQLAYDLKRRHGCYTAACFKRAASERQRMIITMKKQFLKEDIRKQASILSSEILKYYERPRAEHRAEIERVIDKLKNELHTEDKGHGLLKDLMNTVEDVERNLQDVIQLHSLYEELERTKEAVDIQRRVANSSYVAGGILTLVFPLVGVQTLICLAVTNNIGKGILLGLGYRTIAKIKDLTFNIQSRHQKLHEN